MVLDLIMKKDIVGIQKLLGMKIDSEYASNLADGKIGKNTIQRMQDPFWLLSPETTLVHPQIPVDVKMAFIKFKNGEKATNGQ